MTDTFDRLGGVRKVARLAAVSTTTAYNWRERGLGIPALRCPFLELHSNGSVRVEEMRSDAPWARVPDPNWPHPKGRPVLDPCGVHGTNADALSKPRVKKKPPTKGEA